ncbi:MAG: allophanate hydrolase, partial [Comamonas sp.]
MLIGTLDDWKNAYAQGATPADLLEPQRHACEAGDTAWISIADSAQLQAQIDTLAALERAVGRDQLPL